MSGSANKANTVGMNRIDLKKANRGQIIKLIATGECSTRSELVKRMGLTKMSITNMVAELEEQDLLVDAGVTESKGAGRNPIEVRISPHAPKIIGLMIIHDRCEAVICDFYLNTIKRDAIKIRASQDSHQLTKIIYHLIDEMLSTGENVCAIGIAALGPLDIKKGEIKNPPLNYHISNFPIVDILKKAYHLPVYIMHDNQAGALEEMFYGNARNIKNFMLLGVERGVSCGIIMDGVVRHGGNDFSLEIGHMSINYDGEECLCGNHGCWELYINSQIVAERLSQASGKNGDLEFFSHQTITPEMDAIYRDVANKFAVGLINVVNI
ncbi:MAG: ROK family protein, partial [Bilifractor sp.]